MKVINIEKVIILSRLFQFGWSEERKKEFEKDLTEILEMYSFDLDEHDKQMISSIQGGGLMSFRLSQKYIDFCKDMNSNADFLEGT